MVGVKGMKWGKKGRKAKAKAKTGKGKGWRGESRRHILAKYGISTVLPDGRRLPVDRFIAMGEKLIKYIGEGRSMHGYLDRSWDEHLFEEEDGTDISVIIFTEPDWESISDMRYNDEFKDVSDAKTFEEYSAQEERNFERDGEIHVIWAGAIDFIGTEKEFRKQYPDLNKHLEV